MLVRKFMLWVGQVSASERAEGAGALARAYLYSDLQPTEKREAEVALLSLLDDPSEIVRKSIAQAFASVIDAPHAICWRSPTTNRRFPPRAVAGRWTDLPEHQHPIRS
jgi:uncharacterized protein (DUF2336 family)